MTDSIDVKHGSNTRFDFGFIAGAAGLKLTPADGDMAILYFIDQQQRPTEIFRLPDINRVSHKVFIRNTPRSGSAGGHFHLFYDHLFQGVGGNQRFDLQMHYPPIPVGAAATCSGVDPDPDPFLSLVVLNLQSCCEKVISAQPLYGNYCQSDQESISYD